MAQPKHIEVKVPQSDGEIVIHRGITEPKTYAVSGGTTKVATEDLDHFLAVVDGAEAKTTKEA